MKLLASYDNQRDVCKVVGQAVCAVADASYLRWLNSFHTHIVTFCMEEYLNRLIVKKQRFVNVERESI